MGSVWLLLALLSSVLFSSSSAYNFYVGGNNGWVLNPSESYNHWAERNRFQVNDTLTFKIKEGSADSVLVVKKDDYYSCNTSNPILILQSATSVFKFDRSGPFFFITANKPNCQKGQRLIVVVLAVRPKTPSPVLPPTPKSSPVSPSPAANSPKSSISPSPAANSPASSPPPSASLSPTPTANSPKSYSPSPAANSPESYSPSPSSSPSLSPSPAANSSPTPSPAAQGPVMSPSPANSPEASPAPVPSPGSGETANINSPAPTNSKSGSQAITASSSMMLISVAVIIMSFVN
ncbi:early nodulin-like protein 1 [Euphorbia lathyris]|uniref:early nodulin-like protein 1 n=1 Tax=Euphorbia lathyris TaxID=212925 RepID=UPI0033144CAF